MTLSELYIRRTICDTLIRELMNMADDPRQPSALEHYRGELATIDAQITALEKAERQRLGLPEPKPVTVGLKPVYLFGESK